MLILGRKVGESIIVGDNEMIIKVISCFKGQTRLAIEAPHYIKVHREEIYHKIKKNNPEITFASIGSIFSFDDGRLTEIDRILTLNGGVSE